MATKPSSAKNTKKPKRRTQSRAVVGGQNRLPRRRLLFTTLLIFGAVGVYLLAQSGALQSDETLLADAPERGLLYEGKKVKTKGPCKGGFDVTTTEEEKAHGKDARTCEHLDPTPPGVDIRERIKKVDQNLASLAAHDEKIKPVKSDDTPGMNQTPLDPAATISGASLDGIGARRHPCFGTGADGARLLMIYVYPAGGSNRISDLRPGFNAIANRLNSIVYESGYSSGNAQQIRFSTNGGDPGCFIRIPQEPIAASNLDDISAMKATLRARGYDNPGRKYMVWVDRAFATQCGRGGLIADSKPDQTNANNSYVSYAWIWKGCWNYAEPHELFHMLGAVQTDAPYSTNAYHCRDDNDVMCYNDGYLKDGTQMLNDRCPALISLWRLDCGKDTYYRGINPSSGYLSNHWNTANSQFLTR